MTVIDDRLHIVYPPSKHTHTIILLHGRGSNGTEFSTDFLESQASDKRTLPEIFPTVKWVFPTAKNLRSVRFDVEMSQWFDMWSTECPSLREEEQVAALNDSVTFLLEVIRQEVEAIGVGPSRIILGGISQGCATTIHTLFQSTQQLGGFLGFCGWLPFHEQVVKDTSFSTSPASALRDIRKLLQTSPISTDITIRSELGPLQTPVFLSHSVGDPVINIENGRKLNAALQGLRMAVEWKAYDNEEHWITEPEGVDDMVAFLEKIVII